MPTRLPLLLAASWLVLPGLAVAAEGAELSPEKVAHIRHDESQALQKVDEELGNRKPSEMSTEERSQAIQKQQAASAAVMDKHGVTAKEYARYSARMTQEETARAKAEEQRLETQAKAASQAPPSPQAAQAGEKPPAEEEIPIQQGFSDEDPVELEAAEGAEPVVDVGLPGEKEGGGEAPEEENMGAAEEQPAKRAAAERPTRPTVKKRASKRQRGSGE